MEVNNDVITISEDDVDKMINIPNDKPLMHLFKKLIGNDTKHNTVLTNVQILDILQNELNVEVMYTHDLEVEIYLNIIKKFLKDWPQWDEFDKTVSRYKTKGDYSAIERLLVVNHNSLKTYLKTMLEMAKPLAKEALDKTLAEQKKDDEPSNVVMQVKCTWPQLSKLFFRRPNPTKNNSIFNTTTAIPMQISVMHLPLEAILNWFDVSLVIFAPCLLYKRRMIHERSHVLVNKKLNCVTEKSEELNHAIEYGYKTNTSKCIKHEHILKVIRDILSRITGDTLTDELIRKSLEVIESELLSNMQSRIYLHLWYRQYMSKYAYVRYLYTDVNNECRGDNNYDLQLQETVCPRYFCYIGRFSKFEAAECPSKWVRFMCNICTKKFKGKNMAEELRQHIMDYHIEQPNLRCCNCKKEFTVLYLAENNWKHEC